MKKPILLALGLALLLAAAPVFASENAESASPGLLHSLQANRSLLIKYQDEYIRLKSEMADKPSATLTRKMRDLEDKIRALEEDSEELQSFLPVSGQARIFLRDLMAKKADAEKAREAEVARKISEASPPAGEIPAGQEDVYRMHEQALKYVSEKRYKEAIDLYQEIVLRNPDDDQAYMIMGHTYLLTGQYQKAERAFNNAVHIDPQNINDITPFYENMVLQNPNDDMAYTDLGYACLILGDAGKAADAFKEALHINPDNEPAQRGKMYLKRLEGVA